MTTRDDIQRWAEQGISKGHRYMVVMCDTYDWTDYPKYFNTLADARISINAPGKMQKYMESYDLQADLASQLAMRRNHAALKTEDEDDT